MFKFPIMKRKQEIIELMNGDQPVLLHFYMADCTKHKAIRSILHRLQKTQKDTFLHTVNIEIKKQPRLGEELEIEGVPTVLLFVNGKEKWRRTGEVSETQILKALEQDNRNN